MLNANNPPCHGCTKRAPGCHSTCPEFEAYREQRERIYKNRHSEKDILTASFDGVKRVSKARNKAPGTRWG